MNIRKSIILLFSVIGFIILIVYTNCTYVYSENIEPQVIYNFANDINDKNYEKALKNLTSYQASGFAMDDKAPLRNIEHMEILKLVDKTKDWQPGLNLNLKTLYSYKIYYAEIKFKVNNIIAAYTKNGINYRKIVITKASKNEPWLIVELSAVQKE